MPEKKPFTGMPCEEFTQLAAGSFENGIGLRDRLRMFWHKIECVYCRRFFAQIKRIRVLLSAIGTDKPMPAELRARLEKRMSQK